MQENNDCSIIVSPDVVFQELDNETVLLDLKSETYFGLDELGTRIWQLAVEFGSRQKVIEKLLEEYAVEEKTLNMDVNELLNDLARSGLIVLS